MEVHLQFLAIVDNLPVSYEEMDLKASASLKKTFEIIKTCPSVRYGVDVAFVLPPSAVLFPKQCLNEHMETKWERFARSKGIKKRSRRALVYNEEVSKYIPRFGPHSKNNLALRMAIRDDVTTTSVLRKTKKKKIERNRKNMIANHSTKDKQWTLNF